MQVRNHIIPDGKYRIKDLIEKFDNNMLNLSTKVSLMVLGHRNERIGGSRIYHIDRKDQEEQSRKSGIDTPISPI